MDALTLTIAIACVTSVGGAVLGYLFHLEREQADELAADNSRLRDAIRSEAKKAEALSDEFAAVKSRMEEALQLRCNEVTDLKSDVGRLTRQNKEKGKSVLALSKEVNAFHKRGYIRNAYGTLQRYADWLENGDKKPRPKPKKAKVAKAVTPKAPKQLTRAEACLAILNEAKDAGFDWAESAIEQFDVGICNNNREWDKTPPLSAAVGTFNRWTSTRQKWGYWYTIAHSEQVKSFQPKTQWPA